jgi:hypothetical protein
MMHVGVLEEFAKKLAPAVRRNSVMVSLGGIFSLSPHSVLWSEEFGILFDGGAERVAAQASPVLQHDVQIVSRNKPPAQTTDLLRHSH